MKKNFSDYPIYAIPDDHIIEDNSMDSGMKIMVFSSTDLSDLERAKLEQIVGAINIKPNEVLYAPSSNRGTIEQLLNALMDKKVSYGISFSSENPKNALFQIIQEGDSAIILSCPISDLIKDEEAAITTRRKALWMAMKNWK